MLVGLFGGRVYVKILDATDYLSGHEYDYALWVVTFVPGDMG